MRKIICPVPVRWSPENVRLRQAEGFRALCRHTTPIMDVPPDKHRNPPKIRFPFILPTK